MSPTAAKLLSDKIVPLIQTAVAKGKVKPIAGAGGEDVQEVTSDCIAQAAQMLHAAESAGRKFTAGTVASFAVKSARSGRRSTSASRTDVYSPGCLLDGRAALMSVHESVGNGDGDDELTLLDTLAAPGDDPGSHAARNCDWSDLEEKLDCREKTVLQETAEGYSGKHLAASLGVSTGRASQIKAELGRRVREALGGDILATVTVVPGWRKHVAAFQEKRACRRKHLCHATM